MNNEYFEQANRLPISTHFTTGVPQTQLQVAFREHYNLWKNWFPKKRTLRSLEVGCGRGNMSLYLNDDGIITYMLDASKDALDSAKANFKYHGKRGHYFHARADNMPFPDEYFDVVFSVGLLEHLSPVGDSVKEMFRVTRRGGTIIYYVVPDKWSVQDLFKPINLVLRKLFGKDQQSKKPRELMIRTAFSFEQYEQLIMQATKQTDVYSCGTFPIPLISHSVDYPFTPMWKPIEWLTAKIMRGYLWLREIYVQRWICSPTFGQGYLYIQVKK